MLNTYHRELFFVIPGLRENVWKASAVGRYDDKVRLWKIVVNMLIAFNVLVACNIKNTHP